VKTGSMFASFDADAARLRSTNVKKIVGKAA